jgi:hypothetical protein
MSSHAPQMKSTVHLIEDYLGRVASLGMNPTDMEMRRGRETKGVKPVMASSQD